ncbi:MAG TPA: 4Fe-4S dicluster domain-containing protein [Candidatus Hydrogenedentes bacterium]|nr:4Fe-4S dicluster domain-containing protein [Candidatus Hydrogenedentota bacterium]HOV73119.1 4Fe-4S dicluster domain-containing protein [Candidatus Hydrogenedentota bacterium]HPC16219.1 4Fe-4S dicluster domain-containing protein [Candidatus Hydrogenedentota bacterium]HRT18569.1 4Fe-4S dicluster domain-containing protein [Candidatus Hydrogenedentota bacterium]HRT63588.1 4Fe-4S dicluster domain-containing protein [Candidatus Hydrogenedentota bacterium]
MIEQLRETCKRLLEEGTVNVVIGYGQDAPKGPVHPVFVTRPDQVNRLVWNDRCFNNLATYLTRRDIKALGKPAIVVKGCDERAVVVLEQESQFKREDIYVIGMACDGVGSPRLAKCAACSVHVPRFADETIGVSNVQADGEGLFAELDAFLQKPLAERLEYWMNELSRCVKCYACREVCPMCYCNRCIVDKNRPTVLDTSATLKGNFAWQITRAFHQAGRCVSCGECARVCPAGIDLSLLNLSLVRAAEEHFAYRAGMDKDTPPVIGSYALEDKENFIL